jgi:hypothetical protein
MSLISLAILIIIVGVALWAVNTAIPMQANIKTILNVVVVACTLFYVAQAFGLIDGTPIRLR